MRAEAAENSRVVIQQPMSRKEIAPHFEVPHSTILTPRTELADKLLIEISRGCTEMCRFCWAGYNYLPVRAFPTDRILQLAGAMKREAGFRLAAIAGSVPRPGPTASRG